MPAARTIIKLHMQVMLMTCSCTDIGVGTLRALLIFFFKLASISHYFHKLKKYVSTVAMPGLNESIF